jgi:hypothetical protein
MLEPLDVGARDLSTLLNSKVASVITITKTRQLGALATWCIMRHYTVNCRTAQTFFLGKTYATMISPRFEKAAITEEMVEKF